MARGPKIALLVISSLLVLAVLAWLNRPRDEPAKATVQDAVRAFRASDESEQRRDNAGEPPAGVYRYATDGSESVKGLGFGATHDYDGVSTIAISAGRCGERERWQVLRGRWSEAETCTAHGESITTLTEFHEFFNSGQEDSLRCHGAPATEPSELRPGTRFSSACESQDSSVSTVTRIVGVEAVSVGGKPFDAIHIESRSVLGGSASGIAKLGDWRRRSDGLLLRRSAEGDADSGAGGGTHYSERYTIRLLGVTPER